MRQRTPRRRSQSRSAVENREFVVEEEAASRLSADPQAPHRSEGCRSAAVAPHAADRSVSSDRRPLFRRRETRMALRVEFDHGGRTYTVDSPSFRIWNVHILAEM